MCMNCENGTILGGGHRVLGQDRITTQEADELTAIERQMAELGHHRKRLVAQASTRKLDAKDEYLSVLSFEAGKLEGINTQLIDQVRSLKRRCAELQGRVDTLAESEKNAEGWMRRAIAAEDTIKRSVAAKKAKRSRGKKVGPSGRK
jgi:predicted nuclease with TOPRIM domain